MEDAKEGKKKKERRRLDLIYEEEEQYRQDSLHALTVEFPCLVKKKNCKFPQTV